eukprot:2372824-Rhodomonas_salina.1
MTGSRVGLVGEEGDDGGGARGVAPVQEVQPRGLKSRAAALLFLQLLMPLLLLLLMALRMLVLLMLGLMMMLMLMRHCKPASRRLRLRAAAARAHKLSDAPPSCARRRRALCQRAHERKVRLLLPRAHKPVARPRPETVIEVQRERRASKDVERNAALGAGREEREVVRAARDWAREGGEVLCAGHYARWRDFAAVFLLPCSEHRAVLILLLHHHHCRRRRGSWRLRLDSYKQHLLCSLRTLKRSSSSSMIAGARGGGGRGEDFET